MDTLSKREIETALSQRLPHCIVTCSINPDASLSIQILAPGSNLFTIANIDRARYPGTCGMNKLIREILEEMVISRQSSHLLSAQG